MRLYMMREAGDCLDVCGRHFGCSQTCGCEAAPLGRDWGRGGARLGMVDGEETWGGLRDQQEREEVAVSEGGPAVEGHLASGGSG